MNVIKRDGKIEPFNIAKIIKAMESAFIEVDGRLTEVSLGKVHSIALDIEKIDKSKDLQVEEIQDIIEKKLMATNRKDVAKAYILYRAERNRIRDRNSAFRKEVNEKLSASSVQNQNANVDEKSFGGRVGEASDALLKKIALEDYLSEMARNNHINNEIYVHDLNSYVVGSHNCLSIPFDDLLANGFNTRQTEVRPANSISTAFQLVAVIFQLQSLQQFGGVSASHIDWTMVPYVRKSFRKHYLDGLKYIKNMPDEDIEGIKNILIAKDPSIDNNIFLTAGLQCKQYAMDMTEKELTQAVEGMYHNLNTLQSRSGNQLPFTSINYGTCTLPEGRMVTKALLEGSIKGVGKLHKTAIFPCGIFQCMKGVNRELGDPNYVNVDWSVNAGYDVNDPKTYVSTMGCRTYNGLDINAEPGTNPQTKDGRGNLAPVTIIMPTLAMMAKEEYSKNPNSTKANPEVEIFMELLDQKIHEARDMLVERFEWMCEQSPESAKFMYENNVMLGYKPEEGIRSALKHGTLVIGQLGLAETLQILIGCDHTEEKGMELAKRIEQLFKDRCAEFKKDLKLNFGVYYTPAENLCYTAMKKFKKQYGVIPNVSDKDFFTNSMHVPVWKEMSPFEKIDIESELTGYSSGGCITYIELEGGIKNNLDALETIVNYAMDKDIPYFAVNVPNDTCLDCGYCDEFNNECPECHSNHIQQLRRVTGYLTGNYTTAFNKGKQQEVQMRVKHN